MDVDAEKVSLRDLLLRLPIKQLWAFLGIVIGLMFAAAGGAWWVRGAIEEAKTSDVERRFAAAQELSAAGQEKAEELRDKDQFLSLYLRYLTSKNEIDASVSVDVARKAFDDYLHKRVDRDKLIIHKGSGRLATVGFKDGSVWTIPRELHAVELR
jgi:hypothetical protein